LKSYKKLRPLYIIIFHKLFHEDFMLTPSQIIFAFLLTVVFSGWTGAVMKNIPYCCGSSSISPEHALSYNSMANFGAVGDYHAGHDWLA